MDKKLAPTTTTTPKKSGRPKSTPKKPRKSTFRPFTPYERLETPDAIFTIKEIGLLKHCSRTTIRQDRKAGKLVCFRQGRSVKATAAAVRDYLALDTSAPDTFADARLAHLPHQKKDKTAKPDASEQGA